MSNIKITEKLQETLAKEAEKFASKEGKLKNSFDKFRKIGLETKSAYSLPLKDTIGKTFREQIEFNSSL